MLRFKDIYTISKQNCLPHTETGLRSTPCVKDIRRELISISCFSVLFSLFWFWFYRFLSDLKRGCDHEIDKMADSFEQPEVASTV